MHSFQWVQGALGVIVALGMTRIAVSSAHMFVARRQVRLDWVPFAWAVGIFFLLLQFSWNFVLLESEITVWSFGNFLALLLFVFNLVVAAALILPNAESQAGGDLRAYFDAHGRWATPFVAAYALLAYPVNWHFAHANPLENPAAALIALFAMAACFARSRRLLSIVTGLNLAAVGLLLMGMALSQ